MMDPLAEVLRSVRLSGGVFLAAQFTAPWSVSVKITPDDCAPFIGKPAQVIGYHVVIEGRLLLALVDEPDGDLAARLAGGDQLDQLPDVVDDLVVDHGDDVAGL